jgi:hypothetical protein
MDIDFAYSPVIKGKLNDIKATSQLSANVSKRIKPVFELPPFAETDKPEQVIARFGDRLVKNYSANPCYVDFPLLKSGAKTSTGEGVLTTAYRQLNALSINFEPVYGFDRDNSQWPVVIQQARRSGGMLLRLEADDMEFASDSMDRIQELSLQGLDLRQMDVLLDCRYLPTVEAAGAMSDMAAAFLETLATSFSIRKAIVAGSTAPKTVSAIPENSSRSLNRNELWLWTSLRVKGLGLDVVYGDYGVIHPDFTDLTPSPNINGKIRYTQGKDIHIFRGQSLRKADKYDQYRRLSHGVINSGFYQGHMFSHGDRYIYDCANGQAKTGSPGVWVLNDQNHHFTYVAQQIQRLETLIYRGFPQDAVLQQA